MQNRIEILNATLSDDELRLTCETEGNEAERKPSGQMLVDSDNIAFVYILELADSFEYVMIKEHIWPELKQAHDQRKPIVLEAGKESIELSGLYEELEYLLENIKDNANYGEEMEEKVKRVFL
ncbi:hypothetical protein BJH90_15640 [Bacillus halotolerans]|uniref:UPF0738 protein CUU63_13370 n=1 Tax=Bacillus halotolerans TaxID=260554 RepID=A0A9Q2QVC0_9BACI|nr:MULTISPECIES: hypothetical protein [Bacillus]QQF62527.1 hypothetical protein I9X38_19365 [Bacillus mojavensis]BDG79455.1 UPF0738 protein YjbL [Bacillus subtilis]KUP31158.1 hypothetical protein AU387_16000 [Bacillus halotolerans]KUP33891.1 hypothetical protein AU385_10980 [Bacillus halotolerans]MBJ7572657.1 hypothetical protein [Bacillus halotolerans]